MEESFSGARARVDWNRSRSHSVVRTSWLLLKPNFLCFATKNQRRTTFHERMNLRLVRYFSKRRHWEMQPCSGKPAPVGVYPADLISRFPIMLLYSAEFKIEFGSIHTNLRQLFNFACGRSWRKSDFQRNTLRLVWLYFGWGRSSEGSTLALESELVWLIDRV